MSDPRYRFVAVAAIMIAVAAIGCSEKKPEAKFVGGADPWPTQQGTQAILEPGEELPEVAAVADRKKAETLPPISLRKREPFLLTIDLELSDEAISQLGKHQSNYVVAVMYYQDFDAQGIIIQSQGGFCERKGNRVTCTLKCDAGIPTAGQCVGRIQLHGAPSRNARPVKVVVGFTPRILVAEQKTLTQSDD